MCTIAKYIGKTERLGVKPGDICRIDLNTYQTRSGSPFLWVSAIGCDYLMPFASVVALLHAWEFVEDEKEAEREQDLLEDRWLETYFPGAALQ